MGDISYENFSGVSTPMSGNPYNALIDACNDNAADIQVRYEIHRTTRNKQQLERHLDASFKGINPDPILCKLWGPSKEAGFIDPRNCLTVWARPPKKQRDLIASIQQKLLGIAPNLWVMPPNNLHMTTLEVAHSLTADQIESLIQKLEPKIPEITDYPMEHRARLIRPVLSFDNSALALSWVPAAGEALSDQRTSQDDAYTYHHLRRDIFDLSSSTGLNIGSRYVVPSAHLTIGRFVTHSDFQMAGTKGGEAVDPEKIKKWISKIQEINGWLREEYWPREGENIKAGGEWIVGEEKGLECRKGRLWYGDGERIRLGQGF
ncbi:MAG: hypothetical protein M1834_007298 [Cirrosporium novae-zelandiae]|nr:MAG: hypothetical protein M1834_007298 [Cirrosporium novae-zelandiae]